MNRLRKLLDLDPDTTKAKFFLLVVDKLVIGLFVLGLIGAFLWIRSDSEAIRAKRVADAQLDLERARLEKELLPFILRDSSDVMASGYLLSSALSAKLFDSQVAMEIASGLHARGLPDIHILRIAELALPEGLSVIARHGVRLRSQIESHESPGRDTYVSGIRQDSRRVAKITSKHPSPRLQANKNERQLWADALKNFLPYIAANEERKIATRKFLTRYIGALYFLLQTVRSKDAQSLYFNDSRVLRLIGALDCVIKNWGPKQKAVDYVGNEFAILDLRSKEDLSYALALVDLLEDYSKDKRNLAPEISYHLARLAVDRSFFHRISWIPSSASRAQRDQWWSEARAAAIHSSIQYRAGQILESMGPNAGGAESVLTSFIEEFVDNVTREQNSEALSLLSSRYGSYSVRTAVAVLRNLKTKKAETILQKVRNLEDEKIGRFEGLRQVLSATQNH